LSLNGQLIIFKEVNVEKGKNKIVINQGLKDVRGVLQLKTTSPKGELFINRIIKLE